jgi:voltage-gated potassium channel
MRSKPATEFVIGFLAIVSIILIALESLVQLSPGWLITIYVIDLIICIIFAWDFIYRLYHSEDKKRFLKYNGYEILAIIPAIALYGIGTVPAISEGLRALRLIRVVRIIAVFARTTRFFKLSGRFIQRSRLISLLAITLTIILIGAFAVLLAERNMPDARITNFPDALWWSISTITTVGYGDIVPGSEPGRIVGMVLMILGIAVMTTFIAQISATIVESRIVVVEKKNLKSVIRQEIKDNIDRLEKLSDEEINLVIQMIHSIRQLEKSD